MRKKIITILFLIMFGCFSAAMATFALADAGNVTSITVKKGTNTIQGITANPVTYTEFVSNGMLNDFSFTYNQNIAGKAIIYTASFPFTTTKRTSVTEYVLKQKASTYEVTEITSGNSYIPVAGMVLSLPNISEYANFANVGDLLTVTLPSGFIVANKAVECKGSGVRIAIDALNATRSSSMVVYYDYQYGSMTGTNQYGTEMVATYDKQSGQFIVNQFRAFGSGTQAGIEIPDFSFVLSGYGTPYRGFLMEGVKFNSNDKLDIVGFEFVRTDSTVTGTFNFINPTIETNPVMENGKEFPALRGPDQTIIYKEGWNYNNASGTGANVYGFEAAVNSEGVVVERAVNVSSIPKGGYVVSGHGKGRDFIIANVPLGATVALDETNKTYKVNTTLNSYYENVKKVYDESVTYAKSKVSMLYDVDAEEINSLISQAETEFEKLLDVINIIKNLPEDTDSATRTTNLMDYNAQMIICQDLAYQIKYTSMESPIVSARAVWHRPNIVGTETTLQGIKNTLQIFKDCNINLIFVETFFNGMSMFKSDYIEYNKNFTGYKYGDYSDYLTAFVTEADKMGIEVHAWVEDFFVGLTQEIKIIKDHPDWLLYNDDGSVYQRNEGGAYVFIDPSNSAVQQFLLNYYLELIEKQPLIKGVNLDYIRYPVSSKDEDVGYTKNAMLEFSKSLNITLNDDEHLLKNFKKLFNATYYADATGNYNKWGNYKVEKITSFVKTVSGALKAKKNSLLISTAIFASISDSKNKKMQDWQTWIEKGYIDIATPMAYYDSATDVLSKVKDMVTMSGTNCFNYTGLASSYRGLPAYETAIQVDASYLAGADGFTIFASQNLLGDEELQTVLKAGISKTAAVLPHSSVNVLLNTFFKKIIDKSESIYIKSGGMTQTDKANLKAKLDVISAMPYETSVQIFAIMTAVEKLYKNNGIYDYASGYSMRRITEDLTTLYNLLDVKLTRLMILTKEWNTETMSVRPTPGQKMPDENNGDGKKDDTIKRDSCKSQVDFGLFVIIAVLTVSVIIIRKRKNIAD